MPQSATGDIARVVREYWWGTAQHNRFTESQQQLRSANRLSGRVDIEPLVPEMHHSKLKLAAIDPKVTYEINRHAKDFREFYFR